MVGFRHRLNFAKQPLTSRAAAMILYALRCSHHHQFDAWFANSASFDKQAVIGAVACPVCGDTQVVKAPMAPRIGRHRGPDAPADGRDSGAAAGAAGDAAVHDASGSGSGGGSSDDANNRAAVAGSHQRDESRGEHHAPSAGVPSIQPSPEAMALRRMLTDLRERVESSCDYVGDRFAEEARRIHYRETDARPIYGEATPADAAALEEEGVAFHQIPWASRRES
jgi:hypothetical protein